MDSNPDVFQNCTAVFSSVKEQEFNKRYLFHMYRWNNVRMIKHQNQQDVISNFAMNSPACKIWNNNLSARGRISHDELDNQSGYYGQEKNDCWAVAVVRGKSGILDA
jgi:hypothetical protein